MYLKYKKRLVPPPLQRGTEGDFCLTQQKYQIYSHIITTSINPAEAEAKNSLQTSKSNDSDTP
jgi:hypothetical protein